MSDEDAFLALIRRVRAGDDDAAVELIRQYEPAIRRAVRFRLVDTRLRRTCDSMDICQAVMGSFFVRAALGQYELDSPEQLLKLLAAMARNKLLHHVHHEGAERRDYRRVAGQPIEDQVVTARGASPSRDVGGREMLQEAYRRFTDQERRLLDLRNQGRDWREIAAEMGGTPDALRKRLERAVERVAAELELEETDDE